MALYRTALTFSLILFNLSIVAQLAFDPNPVSLFQDPGQPYLQYPKNAAAMDINGDGLKDLVVGHRKGVLLYFNEGGGKFSIPFELDSNLRNTEAASLAVLDWNGDGYKDLAVSVKEPFSDRYQLQVSNGTGFGLGALQTVDSLLSPSSIQGADLDADGKDELVAAVGRNDGDIFDGNIFLYNQIGGGVFVKEALDPIDECRGYRATQIVDFNNDGVPDIIGAVNCSGDVNGFANDGSGSFTKHTLYNQGARNRDNQLAYADDANGDGFVDLFLGDRFGLDVLYNDGSGSFSPGIRLLDDSILWNTANVRRLDMDADGDRDFLILEFQRQGSGFGLDLDAIFGRIGWLEATPTGPGNWHQLYDRLPHTRGIFGNPADQTLILEDFNGDGHKDILAIGQENNRLMLWPSSPSGTLMEPYLIDSLSWQIPFYFPTVIHAEDLDMDGDMDLQLARSVNDIGLGYSYAELEQDAGTFRLRNTSDPTLLSYDAVAGDIDGDGAPDRIVLQDDVILLRRSQGGWSISSDTLLNLPFDALYGFHLSDLGNDGDLDFVARVYYPYNTILTLRNNGLGTFDSLREDRFTSIGLNPLLPMLVEDLNADGLPELVSTFYTGPTTLSALKGRSNGQWGAKIDAADTLGNTGLPVSIGLSSSGHRHVVASRSSYSRLVVHTTSSMFTEPIILAEPPSPILRYLASDFDQDGIDELVYTTEGGEVHLLSIDSLWNTTDLLIADHAFDSTINDFYSINLAAADMDNDGDSDLILASAKYDERQFVYFENQSPLLRPTATSSGSIQNTNRNLECRRIGQYIKFEAAIASSTELAIFQILNTSGSVVSRHQLSIQSTIGELPPLQPGWYVASRSDGAACIFWQP